MTPEIEYFVDNFIDEHNRDNIITAFDLLDQFGVEEYQERFITLMMIESDIGTIELVDSFTLTINNLINELLKIHGIVFNDIFFLETKNKILEGILVLQDLESKDSILTILESSSDSVEKFCEIIVEVTDLNFMYVLSAVEEVNPIFITKLNDLLNTNIINISEEEMINNDFSNKIITKLKNIKSFINYDKAVGFTLVNNNTVLGSNFTKYVTYAVKHFEHLTNEDIAKEVFVLLTMSDEGFEQPLITFRNYSQNLFSDLDKITKIDILLNKLIMQFDKFILQNQSTQLLQS